MTQSINLFHALDIICIGIQIIKRENNTHTHNATWCTWIRSWNAKRIRVLPCTFLLGKKPSSIRILEMDFWNIKALHLDAQRVTQGRSYLGTVTEVLCTCEQFKEITQENENCWKTNKKQWSQLKTHKVTIYGGAALQNSGISQASQSQVSCKSMSLITERKCQGCLYTTALLPTATLSYTQQRTDPPTILPWQGRIMCVKGVISIFRIYAQMKITLASLII